MTRIWLVVTRNFMEEFLDNKGGKFGILISRSSGPRKNRNELFSINYFGIAGITRGVARCPK